MNLCYLFSVLLIFNTFLLCNEDEIKKFTLRDIALKYRVYDNRNNQDFKYLTEYLQPLMEVALKYDIAISANPKLKELEMDSSELLSEINNIDFKNQLYSKKDFEDLGRLPDLLDIEKRTKIIRLYNALDGKEFNFSNLDKFINHICDKSKITQDFTTEITLRVDGFCVNINSDSKDLKLCLGESEFFKKNDREIEATIAHELGHVKHNDPETRLKLNRLSCMANYGVMIYSMLRGKSVPGMIGKAGIGFATAALVNNGLIRKFARQKAETKADLFAFEHGYAHDLKESLKISEQKNRDAVLSGNISFGDKLEFVLEKIGFGDHPSYKKRIKDANDYLMLNN